MVDADVRLKPTFRHPRAEEWHRAGGPWDVPDLDHALAPADPASEARIDALAGALREAGVEAGDTVAWQRPNVPYSVTLFRACWRVGAVAAPIHHLAGPRDLERALEILRPRVFVDRHDPLPRGGTPWPRNPDDGVARVEHLAVALCTAGSTGAPRVVLHTHRALVYKARLMTRVHDLGPNDRVLMPAPLAHISGLLNGVLVPGVSEMAVTLMARWHPDEALELIERNRVTFMVGPPAFFVSLMEAEGFDQQRVTSLRLVSCGGAGITPAFVERATETLACQVKRTYGSTEAPSVSSSYPYDFPERFRETDGRPIGEVEIRLVDPASGEVCPPGQDGEVWVRGPEVCEGYADPEDTAKAFTEDGWFRTGDLGFVDTDGFLTIAGRQADVIIRGGENIAAGQVEAVLEEHPDVRQAVVVGLSDERLGERVCAFVVAARPFGLEDCRAWFDQQGVARFTWPEQVEQRDELPLLPSGKPDRAALRSRLAVRSAGTSES